MKPTSFLQRAAVVTAAPSGGPEAALRRLGKKPGLKAKDKAEALSLADQIETARAELVAANAAAKRADSKLAKLVSQVSKLTTWSN